MNFRVRAMLAADWPQVAAIYREGIESGLATFEREVPDYATWNARHAEVGRLVAESAADMVLGWAALSPVSDRQVYRGVAEVSVYVAREYQRRLVGTALLKTLAFLAEQAGVWMIQAAVFADNAASLALHRKCGFRVVGYREKIGMDQDGVWRNTVLLERRSPFIQ